MEAQSSKVVHIPGRIPTLEIIHDRFVRMFRITLSGALRKPVDVSVRKTELLRFDEYLVRLEVPSSLNLFRLNPLQGTAIMSLETRLVFKLVDIFYGGTGELEVESEGRDFTPIEQRLIKRVVIAALEDLQTAWNPYFNTRIAYQRTEINPMFVAIVPQSETVVVVTFDVDMGGEIPFTLTICMPYSMIQPLVLLFKAKSILKSPIVKSMTGILELGYKSTPLPTLVGKVKERIKQGISKPEPAPTSPRTSQTSPHSEESSLELLKTIDPKMVAGLVANEHPQTIALILAHVKAPDHTARILRELPPDLQTDVSYRMATMESIPPGVITEIEAVLSQELKAYKAASFSKVGGIESMAEILNAMDVMSENRILTTIEASNPELAERIRELMFTLEDLVLINAKGMESILKETPQNDLVLAMKTASDAVKDHIFNCMSKRAADMLKDDLDIIGPVKVVDVEKAQQKLVKTARDLEAKGKIIISGARPVENEKKKSSVKKPSAKSKK